MNKQLTPAELAELLGMATQTIYNRHCEGASLPPCVRIGRLIRFPEDGVQAWLDAQREQPLPVNKLAKSPGRPTKAVQIARRKGGAA
ncbi:MAG: helix-turn-helix domain-containing protein [Gammaproteobacteria bacterium]|nr:helix-turn-helix domain-containing protein [Gammaproteobacteria bacterium]